MNPRHHLWQALIPTIDWDHRHLRTPDGNIVPFAVIGNTLAVLAVLATVEMTFGITNWISIPAALMTIGWAGDQIDIASINHHSATAPPPDTDEG